MSYPAPSRRISRRRRTLPGAALALVLAAPVWAGAAPGTAAAAPGTAAADPPPSAASPAPGPVPLAQLPALSLHELLASTSGRLIEVRRIDLRREEAEAEITHLKASRAFQVEVEGNYSEEEVDRYEVNGDNIKEGELEDIRRRLTFSITHPLLGQSVEDRLLTANQELRIIELEESAAAARSEATIGLIGAYVDLGAEQRHRELRARAIALTERKVRILEQRAERGESLRRDVLAAKADLAGRRADAAEGARLEVELTAYLGVMVDGEAPGPFRATALDWSKMMPAPGAPPAAVAPVEPPLRRGPRSSVWYNLPEIDLRFFYSFASRDRTFADEDDSEEGHIPGVEVTLEFPLELWRSGQSFSKQVEARYERQRLAILAIEREAAGRATAASLAHDEAAARLAAAEAELALRAEDRRVAGLRATDVGTAEIEQDIEVIDAELEVIDAEMEVAVARGELARRYFERAMAAGADPVTLAAAASPAPSSERMAEATPKPGPPDL